MEGGTRLFAATVIAADVERAAVFYRDVLGIELQGERHGEGPWHYHAGWGFPDRGSMFTIWPGEPQGRQDLAFIAEDLDTVHDRALAHGVEVLVAPGSNDAGAPPGWRDCTLRDPAGNIVRVVSQPS
jgi:catechol 2,3-dioxygenase-like lactoylglutathione lyase family enzyme